MRRFVLGLAAFGLLGCGEAQEGARPPLTDEQLRARTSVIYPSVDMYKPVAGEHSDLDVYQAPIFYREHPVGEASIDQDLEFARLVLKGGSLDLDVQAPAVYTHRGRAAHGGIEHDQLTYIWFRRESGKGPIRAQGLRLTYDSTGYPAIFEVLEDESGKSLFYVSAGLEKLALEHHGQALDERTHAIEPSSVEAPNSLVVRLVKQGAQPLGPLVYDGFEGADILQLHCRCAPSQLKAIGASVNYELIPMDSLEAEVREALAKSMNWGEAAVDLGFPAPIWPFASLRLPEAF